MIAQIIILLIFFITYLYSSFYRYFKDKNILDFLLNFFVELFIFSVIFVLTLTLLFQRNDLQKGCPVYEKVENVYKLKQ